MQRSSYYSPPLSPKKRRRDAETAPASTSGNLSTQSRDTQPALMSRTLPTSVPGNASLPRFPSRSRDALNKPRPTASTVSPDKFKLHFASKVYRPLAHTSSKTARKSYTKDGNWIGEPDERIGESKTIVRCICRKTDIALDMLQCVQCLTWQHTACRQVPADQMQSSDDTCTLCRPGVTDSISLSGKLSADTDRIADRIRQLTPPPSSRQNATTKAEDDSQAIAASPSDSDSDDELQIEQSPFTSPLAPRPLKTLNADSVSPFQARRSFLAASSSISPLLKATSSHPLLTPTKRTARPDKAASASPDPFNTLDVFYAEIVPSFLPASAEEDAMNPLYVPLPPHYTRLLQIHLGVERALLIHLATDGSRASAAMLKASNESQNLGDGDEMIVDLPALLPFSALQRTVERGSNHRFGPTELAQLVWLWEGGLDGKHANEEERCQENVQRRGGLSLSVTAAKEINKTSRRSTSAWALGIELQIRHNAPVPEYEMINSTSSPRTTPCSPSSSAGTPSKRFKRSGLSVMPLWSSKAAFRKEEVRRRLGQCVLKAHSDFVIRGQPDDAVATKIGRSSISGSRGPFAMGFPLDALPPIPAASLPMLKASSTSIVSRASNSHAAKHTIAAVDANLARTDDKANHERTLRSLLSSTKPKMEAQATKDRADSLLDRIKAKEAAKAQTSSFAHRPDETTPRAKTSAALLSLEQASARARQRESSLRSS